MSRKNNKRRQGNNRFNNDIKSWPQAIVRIVEVLASKGKLFGGGIMAVLIIITWRLDEEDLGLVTKELLRLAENHYLWGYILLVASILISGAMLHSQRRSFHIRIDQIVKAKAELQRRLESKNKKTNLIESSK
jgi:hypothetical protein